jgi:hypothetical protein
MRTEKKARKKRKKLKRKLKMQDLNVSLCSKS